MIKVMACNCVHPYQDAAYGVGRRVHNECGRDKHSSNWRCTVCNASKSASVAKATVIDNKPQAGVKKKK